MEIKIDGEQVKMFITKYGTLMSISAASGACAHFLSDNQFGWGMFFGVLAASMTVVAFFTSMDRSMDRLIKGK